MHSKYVQVYGVLTSIDQMGERVRERGLLFLLLLWIVCIQILHMRTNTNACRRKYIFSLSNNQTVVMCMDKLNQHRHFQPQIWYWYRTYNMISITYQMHIDVIRIQHRRHWQQQIKNALSTTNDWWHAHLYGNWAAYLLSTETQQTK